MPQWFDSMLPGFLQDYAVGVALLLTGLVGAGVGWAGKRLYVWWFVPKVRLRRVLRCLPTARAGEDSWASEWHGFNLHHDAGESIRLQACILIIKHRTPTAEELERHQTSGSDRPLAFEPIHYSILEPLVPEPRPPFTPGESVYYAASLSHKQPWELVDASGKFAFLALFSQDKLVMGWDISDELRPVLPLLLEWRQSGKAPSGITPALWVYMEQVRLREGGSSGTGLSLPG